MEDAWPFSLFACMTVSCFPDCADTASINALIWLQVVLMSCAVAPANEACAAWSLASKLFWIPCCRLKFATVLTNVVISCAGVGTGVNASFEYVTPSASAPIAYRTPLTAATLADVGVGGGVCGVQPLVAGLYASKSVTP